MRAVIISGLIGPAATGISPTKCLARRGASYRLLPDARLVVLEGSGHLFVLDEPELAARHVDDFLRR